MIKKFSPLIILSFIAFISLGLPDGLLGVAWPGIRASFTLPLDAMGYYLVTMTAGYTLSSFFNGYFVKKIGLGGLLGSSCILTGISLFIYTMTPYWFIFILASFLGGIGAGAIDAGLNTYIAQNHSERMMQWLHACFGVGITTGPLIMTMGIAFTGSWRRGYTVVFLIQILLGVLFFSSRKLWYPIHLKEENHRSEDAPLRESFRSLPVWLSMFIFFIYVGTEIGMGLWAFTFLTEARGISEMAAGFVTGSYWAVFTLGRILAGLYGRKISLKVLMNSCILLSIAGTLMLLLPLPAVFTMGGICLTGFAVAPIFPGLVSDTEIRVGRRHLTNAIGMQFSIAGIGAAVMPSLAGVLARKWGLEMIPLFVLTAELLLLGGYALSHGSRPSEEE